MTNQETSQKADSAKRTLPWHVITANVVLLLMVAGLFASRKCLPENASGMVERPTPSLLLAARDLGRLETTQVHVEKIVDLKDKQSSFFGMVESSDAVLLVAVGRATVGIDLETLSHDDVTLDAAKTAHFALPQPRVLDAALDEEATYVYSRQTELLARRNEALEANARRLAVRAVEQAADTDEVKRRARESAERQLSTLARALGAARVEFRWKQSLF